MVVIKEFQFSHFHINKPSLRTTCTGFRTQEIICKRNFWKITNTSSIEMITDEILIFSFLTISLR